MTALFIVYSTYDGCVLAEGVPVDCIGTTAPAPRRGPDAHLMRGTIWPTVDKELHISYSYQKDNSMILYSKDASYVYKYDRDLYDYSYSASFVQYDIDCYRLGYKDSKAPKMNCVYEGERCVAFPVGSSAYYFRVIEGALELAGIVAKGSESRYRAGRIVSTHKDEKTIMYSGGLPNCKLLNGEVVGLYHAGNVLDLPKEPADVARTVKIRESGLRFRYVYDPATHIWTCSEKIIGTTS